MLTLYLCICHQGYLDTGHRVTDHINVENRILIQMNVKFSLQHLRGI